MRLLLLALLSSTLFGQQTPPAPATRPAVPSPQSQSPPSSATPELPAQTPSAAAPADASASAPSMSPSDAYQYAMQPLDDARKAPDDLTDADKWALTLGVTRAKEQCELRSKDKFDGEDLLAMGKLCIFGQDYDPARVFLISYIGLPQPKSPEVGHLLLARALIGLGSIASAESQMESLLSLFPYDASIHLGIDMVIDGAAASDATDDLDLIPRLEAQQLPHIFDALANGGSLSGNGDAVDAALLVRDALRCADALRRNFKPDDATKILDQLKAAVAAPSIVASASYPAIQNALARYDLFRQPSPVREFHGAELTANGSSIARVVPLYDTNPAAHIVRRSDAKNTIIRILDDRTLVLLFSLGSPACSDTMHGILDLLARDHVTPDLKVIAATSFAANTGVDTPTPQLLAALRAFRSGLPPKLPVLMVPDAQLKPFSVDMWPAAILFDGKGRIRWINTISGSSGSIRQTVRELEMPVPVDFPANSN